VAEQPQWLDPGVLARLTRQFLHARLPMEGNVTGHHKSPHRGSSVEFAEYRKYVPGDDIRRLDWRVYGKTDRFYMREFEADTNLRAYMVLDCSGSMGYGSGATTKLEYARRLLATLAWLTVQQGDAVGISCFDDHTAIDIPPRRNPAHLRTILDSLGQVQPRGETALVGALHDLAERIRRRAMVIIFSDCFCEVEPLLECFQHLRFRKHDLAVFHLLDRAELEFRFDRPVRFVDLETSSSLMAEPAIIRRQYLEQLQEHLDRLKSGCSQFHADYRRITIDQDYEKVLADFLIERARARVGSAGV
jgi:uncharacterized protein (DUF58 family)